MEYSIHTTLKRFLLIFPEKNWLYRPESISDIRHWAEDRFNGEADPEEATADNLSDRNGRILRVNNTDSAHNEKTSGSTLDTISFNRGIQHPHMR